MAEIRLDNGHIPQCLDVITIETQGTDDHPYQKENVMIVEEHLWSWKCKLPLDTLPQLVDDVDYLWQLGFYSTNGMNDRVPEEKLIKATGSSLCLIRPDDFILLVSDDLDGRKKVHAKFAYVRPLICFRLLITLSKEIISRRCRENIRWTPKIFS